MGDPGNRTDDVDRANEARAALEAAIRIEEILVEATALLVPGMRTDEHRPIYAGGSPSAPLQYSGPNLS